MTKRCFYVMLYGSSLILEFVALTALRIREPEMPRPFRMPGGIPGTIIKPRWGQP